MGQWTDVLSASGAGELSRDRLPPLGSYDC